MLHAIAENLTQKTGAYLRGEKGLATVQAGCAPKQPDTRRRQTLTLRGLPSRPSAALLLAAAASHFVRWGHPQRPAALPTQAC